MSTTVTPHDFHYVIDLTCDGAIINLWSKSGTQLAIDLLRRRYSTNMIHYFDIKANYQYLPQKTVGDYA